MNPTMNVSNLEVLYRKYSTGGEKTFFGGNSMHIACRRGDAKWIPYLWEWVDPNWPDSDGYTPLHDAVRHGHLHCVEALIEASKEPAFLLDFETPCKLDGATALHSAVLGGNDTCIRYVMIQDLIPRIMEPNFGVQI